MKEAVRIKTMSTLEALLAEHATGSTVRRYGAAAAAHLVFSHVQKANK